MISSLKTDLSELKEAIINNINNGEDIKNTTSYQIYLDMLTNFPLASDMSTEDFFNFYTKSCWIQSLEDDTKYKLTNVIEDPTKNLINGVSFISNITANQTKPKMLTVKYTKSDMFGLNCIDYLKGIKGAKDISSNIISPIQGDTISKDITYDKTTPNRAAIQSIYSNLFDYININKIGLVKPPKILDHQECNLIQLPSKKLNYFIQKSPFILKNKQDDDILASSKFIFPKKEILYDLIVYNDRLVYITNSTLNSICTYKVFSIPSLELIESGNDSRINVYQKLKLTRKNIVGPNVKPSTVPTSDFTIYDIVNIQHGFKIYNSSLYDIYMNGIRESEKLYLQYKQINIGGHILNLYV